MIDLISEGLFGSFSAIIFTISIASLFLFSCLVMLFPGKRQWVISKAPSLLREFLRRKQGFTVQEQNV